MFLMKFIWDIMLERVVMSNCLFEDSDHNTPDDLTELMQLSNYGQQLLDGYTLEECGCFQSDEADCFEV